MEEFRSKIGKKEDKSAKKTVSLTKKNGLIYILKRIIPMNAYVYKCAMVI